MEKRAISGLMLTLLFIGMLTLAFNIQPVEAESGTIYIRADGSVDPDTASISSVDNVTYTFTDNIYDEIVVERDNIVVDGDGYTLQGSGAWESRGVYLLRRSNVTIKNMEIKSFCWGIYLRDSSNNTISGNNITANNGYGIRLDGSSNNTLRNNDASNNKYNFGVFFCYHIQDIDDSNTVNGKPVYYWVNRRDMTVPLDAGYVALVNCTSITVQNLNLINNGQGVYLAFTTNSTITKNNITNNNQGIRLDVSSNYNSISGNNITNNGYDGIELEFSSNNAISGNNITNNGRGIMLDISSNNTISGNNITENNREGIWLDSAWYNTISGNNITENNHQGILLFWSSNYNTISGNNITNNQYGIWVLRSQVNAISGNNIAENNEYGIGLEDYANYNAISGNNITNNGCGIRLGYWLGDNIIYNNNFISNTQQVHLREETLGYPNIWDDGYPSGGNYWSDHVTVDDYSGINQDEPGSDGIVDEPYIIGDYNRDNYPLVEPWSPLPRTIGELKSEIEKCWSEGEIDNQGIVNSLIVKLNVAQKLVDKGKIDEAKSILEDDFIPQVQNLSGIHITPEAADILIKSAESIVSHL